MTKSIFASVLIAIQLVFAGVAQAECNFFTGWVDNKDGTVRDPRNGLIWKRCAEGVVFSNDLCIGTATKTDWNSAKLMAQQSRFLDKSDWRLPTKEEFEFIMGNRGECLSNEQGDHAASIAVAHAGTVGFFWTSTPFFLGTVPWYVDLNNGSISRYYYPNASYYVRLVRSSNLLGGDASSEFVNERANRAISKAAAIQKAQADAAAYQVAQAQATRERERKLVEFRMSLHEGDDTNCGPIIELKGKLIKVAFAVANYGNEHWIKRDQILSPEYKCRFVNGQYQSEQ